MSITQKAVKVKLDKLTSQFVIYTHCNVKQYVEPEQLATLQELKCGHCNEPFIVKSSAGVWYYTGDKVF